jgi:hypothetical protein
MDNDSAMHKVATISRRQFAQNIASAAVISTLPAGAEDKMSPGLDKKPDDLSIENWNEVQARYRNLLRVYGERLSDEEKRRTVRILISNQHMLAAVRTFVVQNSDSSACTLRVVP